MKSHQNCLNEIETVSLIIVMLVVESAEVGWLVCWLGWSRLLSRWRLVNWDSVKLLLIPSQLLDLLLLLNFHQGLKGLSLIFINQILLAFLERVLFLSQDILDVLEELDALHSLILEMVFKLPPMHLVLVLSTVCISCVLNRHLNEVLSCAIRMKVRVAILKCAFEFRTVDIVVTKVARECHRVSSHVHFSPACWLTQELGDCGRVFDLLLLMLY